MKFGLFVAVAVAILVSLWLLLQPRAEPAPAQPAPLRPALITADVPAPLATPAASEPVRFALSVRDGQVEGPSAMVVTVGTQVQIRIVSDRADELHLHGYDLTQDLKPGEPAELVFRADRSGRFTLELHGNHQEIAALEVYPRR